MIGPSRIARNSHSKLSASPFDCVPGLMVLMALSLAGCTTGTRQDPRLGSSARASVGRDKIEQYGCGSCHTIPGIPGARANVGPPLTSFSRRTYIAGLLPNDPQNLENWISHPRHIRPDTAMPEMGVTGQDATDIAAYLYTLR